MICKKKFVKENIIHVPCSMYAFLWSKTFFSNFLKQKADEKPFLDSTNLQLAQLLYAIEKS